VLTCSWHSMQRDSITSTGTSPAPTASPIGFHSFSCGCCSADIVVVGKDGEVEVWQGRIDELMKKLELDSVGLVVVRAS